MHWFLPLCPRLSYRLPQRIASGLAQADQRNHVGLMRAHPDSPWRLVLVAIGWLLIGITPLVGPLPGPGGIFTLAGGLILVLRNSAWARRRYARLKRRWPKTGDMCDRAMRRRSSRRRRARVTAE